MEVNRHSYYCRQCGHEAVKHKTPTGADLPVGYTCTGNHALLLHPNEVIAGYTLAARIEQLQAMHTMMKNANDEDIYLAWAANGIPDGANTLDLLYIALEDEAYKWCFDLFVKLIARKGNRW